MPEDNLGTSNRGFKSLIEKIGNFFKDMDWLWVVLSFVILGVGSVIAYFLGGLLQGIFGGNRDLAFWILFVVLSGIGGAAIALLSKTVTIKEPALASLFVTLGVLIAFLIYSGWKIETLGVAIVMGFISFFVVFSTAKFGEKKQSEGFEIKDAFQMVGLKGVFMKKKISEITREDLADLWLRLKMDVDIFKDLDKRAEVDNELMRIKAELGKDQVDILQAKADLESVAHKIIEKKEIQNRKAKITKLRLQLLENADEDISRYLNYLDNVENQLKMENPEIAVIDSIMNTVSKKATELGTRRLGKKITGNVRFFPDFLTILTGTALVIVVAILVIIIVAAAGQMEWYSVFSTTFLTSKDTANVTFSPGIIMLVGAVMASIGLIRHMSNKVNSGLPVTILLGLGIFNPLVGAFIGLIIYSLLGNLFSDKSIALAITMILAAVLSFLQTNFVKLLKPLEKAFSPESVSQAAEFQMKELQQQNQTQQLIQTNNMKLIETAKYHYTGTGELGLEKEELTKLLEEMEKAKSELNKTTETIEAKQNELKELSQKAEEKKKDIETLDSNAKKIQDNITNTLSIKQKEIEELQNIYNETKANIEFNKKEIEKKQSEAQDLVKLVSTKQLELVNLEKEMMNKQQDITNQMLNRQQELVKLEQEIADKRGNFTQELLTKKEEIQKTIQDLLEKKQDLQKLNEDVQSKKNEYNQIENTFREKQNEIIKAEQLLNEKRQTLNNLEQDMNSKKTQFNDDFIKKQSELEKIIQDSNYKKMEMTNIENSIEKKQQLLKSIEEEITGKKSNLSEELQNKQREIESILQRILEKQNELQAIENNLYAKKENEQKAIAVVEEKQREIAKLEDIVQSKKQTIIEMEQNIISKKKDYDEFNSKASELDKIKQDIENKKQEINDIENNLNLKKQELTTIKIQLDETRLNAENELNTKQNEINDLNLIIENKKNEILDLENKLREKQQ